MKQFEGKDLGEEKMWCERRERERERERQKERLKVYNNERKCTENHPK